ETVAVLLSFLFGPLPRARLGADEALGAVLIDHDCLGAIASPKVATFLSVLAVFVVSRENSNRGQRVWHRVLRAGLLPAEAMVSTLQKHCTSFLVDDLIFIFNSLQLDIVVQRKFIGVRTQTHGIYFLSPLVLDVRRQQVLGEDVALEQELVVAFQSIKRS